MEYVIVMLVSPEAKKFTLAVTPDVKSDIQLPKIIAIAGNVIHLLLILETELLSVTHFA